MKFPPLFDLSHKVVIQFGFTGAIGQQFSSILAESGCTLILVDLQEEQGRLISDRLKKINPKVEFIQCDASQEEAVKNVVQYVYRQYKTLSVLINAISGKPRDFFKKFEDSDLTSWQEVMNANLTTFYLTCREVSQCMIQNNIQGGSLINIASFLGVVAPDQRVYGNSGINSPAVYTTSKFGVVGLTKYLAAYLGKFNIRVNAISPGGVDAGATPAEFRQNFSQKIPLGRMANMNDMKGPLVFLASDASQYVTGHNLIVDGGLSIW